MSYVYLKSVPHAHPELEPNDVARVLSKTDKELLLLFIRSGTEIRLEATHLEYFDISLTGDEHTMKVCDRCFKLLDSAEHFSNNRHKKDGKITKRPSCKECRKKKDGVPISSGDRKKWIKLRPEPFTSFTCPICLKTTIVGLTKIVLDHCHNSGRVRGWLCESCNTGIGRFDDDSLIASRALRWLEINPGQTP